MRNQLIITYEGQTICDDEGIVHDVFEIKFMNHNNTQVWAGSGSLEYVMSLVTDSAIKNLKD